MTTVQIYFSGVAIVSVVAYVISLYNQARVRAGLQPLSWWIAPLVPLVIWGWFVAVPLSVVFFLIRGVAKLQDLLIAKWSKRLKKQNKANNPVEKWLC